MKTWGPVKQLVVKCSLPKGNGKSSDPATLKGTCTFVVVVFKLLFIQTIKGRKFAF